MRKILVLVAIVSGASMAFSQTVPPTRQTSVQISPQSSSPITSGNAGIWNNNGTPEWQSAGGSNTPLNTATSIQNYSIASGAGSPSSNQCLCSNGSAYTAANVVNSITAGTGLSCTSSTGTPTCSVSNLAGDVTGAPNATTVTKIQGVAVSSTGPSNGQVLEYISGSSQWVPTTIGSAVTSVSNSDGTLTISPTSGAVVAGLATGHANTWSAGQTFNNGDLICENSAGTFASTIETAATAAHTWTLPDATDTACGIAAAQTITNKTLGSSNSIGAAIAVGTDASYDIGASTTRLRAVYTQNVHGGANTLVIDSSSGITISGFTVLGNGSTNDTEVTGRFRPSKTNVADANTSVNTTKFFAWTSISAARAWTGSCATGSTTQPTEFAIVDESGSASGTNTISITPSSGTINGGSTLVCVNSARGSCHFYANGTNCFTW